MNLSRTMCTCGRAEVELGCDLCAHCHREHEERQMEIESAAGLPFIDPADYWPFWVKAGPDGPGGWDCHTSPDGATFPAICLADDCPDRGNRNPQRFHGEVIDGR